MGFRSLFLFIFSLSLGVNSYANLHPQVGQRVYEKNSDNAYAIQVKEVLENGFFMGEVNIDHCSIPQISLKKFHIDDVVQEMEPDAGDVLKIGDPVLVEGKENNIFIVHYFLVGLDDETSIIVEPHGITKRFGHEYLRVPTRTVTQRRDVDRYTSLSLDDQKKSYWFRNPFFCQ